MSRSMIEGLVYTLIAGAILAGFGYAYVSEKRFSTIEAQLSFVMGATGGAKADDITNNNSSSQASDVASEHLLPESTDGNATQQNVAANSARDDVVRAIGAQCVEIMKEIASIGDDGSFISVYDDQRLTALSALIDQVGCKQIVTGAATP